MNFVPQHNGSYSSSSAVEDLAGCSNAPAFFYPARKVTGEHLKAMGLEFIRPDAIASKWRTIHNRKF